MKKLFLCYSQQGGSRECTYYLLAEDYANAVCEYLNIIMADVDDEADATDVLDEIIVRVIAKGTEGAHWEAVS